ISVPRFHYQETIMDPLKNPYCPNAGAPPPDLAERGPILEQGRILFGRVKIKKSGQSMLLAGLRGVGKRVLLNELATMAEKTGYQIISVEVPEGRTLASQIALPLRSLLLKIDTLAGIGDQAKRALRVVGSFISAFKVEVSGVTVGMDFEKGTAD